jgi:hypothetical protein
MTDTPDYARRWEELKRWVADEQEATRDDAGRAGNDSDYDYSRGESQAMSRVLAQMEKLEQEATGT